MEPNPPKPQPTKPAGGKPPPSSAGVPMPPAPASVPPPVRVRPPTIMTPRGGAAGSAVYASSASAPGTPAASGANPSSPTSTSLILPQPDSSAMLPSPARTARPPGSDGAAVGRPVGRGPADARAPAGYEILGELGRGGMGVVYKARDTRLGRLVALKMILSGAHSSANGRERLRREAEAVAQLSHPNIVQVYEVGEHNGLPFVSLEFCEGGTLDKLIGGRPQPPRAAAETLETLARAVSAAHAAGILHRDLKPSNVLLDAAGTPKIGDFGLAKRTDPTGSGSGSGSGSGTGSGAGAAAQLTAGDGSLGSPAYMSPEQASGRADTGPATDIYSLGVILYETLTGRPPFLGDTEVNIIWQLVSREPVPVRQLAPQTPADLETICHKCLQKEPARRYGSASELAADLRAFLEGRPIKARPVGAVERLAKWARRHPAAAALAVVTAAGVAAVIGVGAHYNARLTAALAAAEGEARAKEAQRAVAEQQREAAAAAAAEAKRARDDMESARDAAERQREAAEASRAEAQEAARRATENFVFAREAVERCFNLASEHPKLNAPGMQEARALLLATAREFFVKLAERPADGHDTPESRAELAASHLRSAAIARQIGRNDDGLKDARAARALIRGLCEREPGEVRHRLAAARVAETLAGIEADQAHFRDAETHCRAGLADLEAAGGAERSAAVRERMAALRHALGAALRELGDLRGAEEAIKSAVELQVRSARESPRDPAIAAEAARYFASLAGVLSAAGDIPTAMGAYRDALRIRSGLHQDFPKDDRHAAGLAALQVEAARFLNEAGDAPRAREMAGSSVRIYSRLAEDNPAVPEYRAGLADAEAAVARLGLPLGDAAASRSAFERAVALRERLAAEQPDVPEHRIALAATRAELAALLTAVDPPAAEALFARAQSAQEELARQFPAVPARTADLAQTLDMRGTLALSRGDGDAAYDHYRRALELRLPLVGAGGAGGAGGSAGPAASAASNERLSEAAEAHHRLAKLLGEAGETAAAARQQAAAAAMRLRAAAVRPGAAVPQVAAADAVRELAWRRWVGGDAKAAVEGFRDALNRMAPVLKSFPDSPAAFKAVGYRVLLVHALADAGDRPGAAAEAEAALADLERLLAGTKGSASQAEIGERRAGSLWEVARGFAAAGRPEKAAALFAESADLYLAGAAAQPGNPFWPAAAGNSLVRHARCLAELGRRDEAAAVLARGMAMVREALKVPARGLTGLPAPPAPPAGSPQPQPQPQPAQVPAGRVKPVSDLRRRVALAYSAYALALVVPLQSPKQAEADAAEAVRLLDEAVSEGFPVADFEADDDLKPIRSRDDFKRMLSARRIRISPNRLARPLPGEEPPAK